MNSSFFLICGHWTKCKWTIIIHCLDSLSVSLSAGYLKMDFHAVQWTDRPCAKRFVALTMSDSALFTIEIFSLTETWCDKNNIFSCNQLKLLVEVCTLHLERLCFRNRQNVRSIFSFWLLKLNYSIGKLFNSGTGPILTNISNNILVYLGWIIC